jgi:hypothetical protein
MRIGNEELRKKEKNIRNRLQIQTLFYTFVGK